MNHESGSLSQMREMYYVSCWHLFRKEQPGMWEGFGQDGVAICSRYGMLKAVWDALVERAHIGLVQYGHKHLRQRMRMNVLQFITSKRERFATECEVRAFIEYDDPFARNNLHFDANNFPHRRPLPENEQYRRHWVHDHKRRRIDLKDLIRGVVLSPYTSGETADKTRQWMQTRNLSGQVRWSDLKTAE